MGNVFRVSDHIDTDLIIAARFLTKTDLSFLSSHLFEDLSNNFEIGKYKYIVAGENFGCGSSREHAPLAIKAAGIEAVFAKSFARIFYRNAINIGLKLYKYSEWPFEDKDTLNINGKYLQSKNNSLELENYSSFVQNIVKEGNLIEYGRKKAALCIKR
jgi:3-isopropylmalate/(R)-2-methylmalate dehydratase small subunit